MSEAVSDAGPPGAPWDRSRCSVAGTLAVVGEKWSLLVLREAFLGVRRFADFQRNLGAPRAVLTDRLGTLVDQGILRRVPYQAEGERQRHEYRLTGIIVRPETARRPLARCDAAAFGQLRDSD